MKDEPIVIERIVSAPPRKVWEAITNNEQMNLWYFKLYEFKPEPGFKFQFEGGTEERSYLHLCEVLVSAENRVLKHSWRYDGFEGNSFVTWELSEKNGLTEVRLTHDGLDSFPANNPDFARDNFVQGWTAIVGTSLKEFVEKD